MAALENVSEPEGTAGHAVGLAAVWSLKSQAARHDLVKEHLLDTLDNVADEGMIILIRGCLDGNKVEEEERA